MLCGQDSLSDNLCFLSSSDLHLSKAFLPWLREARLTAIILEYVACRTTVMQLSVVNLQARKALVGEAEVGRSG